jgi:hypothetical protein
MELNDLRADLTAFADDEDEVEIDTDGSFIVVRNGREIAAQLIVDEMGNSLVRRPGGDVTYRDFLLRDLAGLHVFAERLASKRPPIPSFIDAGVRVQRATEPPKEGPALALIRAECEDSPTFSARVSFITGDAGHGKTALLRQFQNEQARSFLHGNSGYIFWHVDLQGRQLLRLSEALAGDLGELRITGMWMPAVVRLMRMRALVLGIDGFDELAAEQGSTDALGALASLVREIDGRGTIIAAARRTFFDTDDYLRRTGLLNRVITSTCEFSQISLLPWTRDQGVRYLNLASQAAAISSNASETYDQILEELGGDDAHPMLTRPFLLAQIARALSIYGISPREFFQVADDSFAAVERVVDAFVKREVSDKWRSRETGEPYLSVEQHKLFLSDVAEEMYRGQKDRLQLDVVETIISLLLDQWSVPQAQRQQIIEMVRMHVLLVPPDGESLTRSFDHPEFRDYFIAYALRGHLDRVMEGGKPDRLAYFLSIAQISDSTARYVCGMLDRTEVRIRRLLEALSRALVKEWRPTFLQINVGTLVPFLLNDVSPVNPIEFEAKVVYSSLVFERTRLRSLQLANGTFLNASIAGVDWEDVGLQNCDLGELRLGEGNRFERVRLNGCQIEGIRLLADGEETREYAPNRIWSALAAHGISGSEQPMIPELTHNESEDTEQVRVFRKFLRVFNRTTTITDDQLRMRFRQDLSLVFDFLIPALESHGVLEQRSWKGAGQKRAWSIRDRVEDILAAEEGLGEERLTALWDSVRRVGA